MKTKISKMMLWFSGIAVFSGCLLLAGIAAASDANVLQPAAVITYNEDLEVNATGRFDSVYIGKQGVGGVTFFNGTIINSTTDSGGADLPVTFGDGVRIDGEIWRGPSKGTTDGQPLKISDSVIPTLTNTNSFGSAANMWKDIYYAGNLTGGGASFSEDVSIAAGKRLQGTGVVYSDNIADGSIMDADINIGAGINPAKIIGTAWTSANDGAGSGLDADMVDGRHYFASTFDPATGFPAVVPPTVPCPGGICPVPLPAGCIPQSLGGTCVVNVTIETFPGIPVFHNIDFSAGPPLVLVNLWVDSGAAGPPNLIPAAAVPAIIHYECSW